MKGTVASVSGLTMFHVGIEELMRHLSGIKYLLGQPFTYVCLGQWRTMQTSKVGTEVLGVY